MTGASVGITSIRRYLRAAQRKLDIVQLGVEQELDARNMS